MGTPTLSCGGGHDNMTRRKRLQCPKVYKSINGKPKRRMYLSHWMWFMNTGKEVVAPAVIHHIDNNPSNNAFENLEWFPNTQTHMLKRHNKTGVPYKINGKINPIYSNIHNNRFRKKNPNYMIEWLVKHPNYMRDYDKQRRATS